MSLREYRRKRDFERTPEPAAARPRRRPKLPRFVVQQHHATRLHWDLRLEHAGVGVSWAVPKGIPADPGRNNLAVHVEDHPLSYFDFEGEIPKGNYGAGKVSIWDRGTYEPVKWQMGPDERKQEVQVVLHGGRLEGRYVLFQTRGKDWMIHRMDPPQDPLLEPMPERLMPMMARLASGLPGDEESYGYEFKWDGIRAVVYSAGGSLTVLTRNLEDVTRRYPELRGMAGELGSRAAVLDGEIVALDGTGRPSFEELQQRMGLTSDGEVRRKMREVPVVFMAFDVLYLEGRTTMALPYRERRRLLEGMGLDAPAWQVPPMVERDGQAMLEASRRSRLEGIMAKRLDGRYEPGRRSGSWLKVKNHMRQEFVIAGWLDGEGRRRGAPGALLLGYNEEGRLIYAGKVGTGFTDRMLEELAGRLAPLERPASPFGGGPTPPRASHFVEPELVAEVEFNEWTRGGQLRAPSFKGLRPDKPARDVVREVPVDR